MSGKEQVITKCLFSLRMYFWSHMRQFLGSTDPHRGDAHRFWVWLARGDIETVSG